MVLDITLKKLVKIIGIVLAGLVGVILVGFIFLRLLYSFSFSRVFMTALFSNTVSQEQYYTYNELQDMALMDDLTVEEARQLFQPPSQPIDVALVQQALDSVWVDGAAGVYAKITPQCAQNLADYIIPLPNHSYDSLTVIVEDPTDGPFVNYSWVNRPQFKATENVGTEIYTDIYNVQVSGIQNDDCEITSKSNSYKSLRPELVEAIYTIILNDETVKKRLKRDKHYIITSSNNIVRNVSASSDIIYLHFYKDETVFGKQSAFTKSFDVSFDILTGELTIGDYITSGLDIY